MALTERDKYLIEQRISGKATSEEQNELTKRMEDPEVTAEVVFQQDLKVAAGAVGKTELKKDLQAIEKRIGQKPARRRTIPPLAWAAAASILLIIAVYLLLPTNPSTDQLFAQYFEPIPNVVSPISKGGSTDDLFSNAFRQYELGRYGEANALFGQLDQSNHDVQFFQAVTQIHLDNDLDAQSRLNAITGDIRHPYRPHAQWYACLLALKQDDKTIVWAILEDIRDSEGHPFAQEAEALWDEF